MASPSKLPLTTHHMEERPTWRIWIILYVVLAVQTTWLADWRPFGARADLPLLTTVSIALLLGWELGAIYGLFAGFLTGCFADYNVGSFAFSRALVGGLFGVFDKGFSRENPLAPPLCAGGAVLLANLIFWIMSPADFTLAAWANRTLADGLLNALLIWPLHWLVARFVLPPTRMMFA
jgi:rod shape-determining protein MreD